MITNCQIKALPSNLNLPKLNRLSIMDVPLESLPETINAPKLVMIHLVRTKVTTIPLSFGDFTKLKSFNFNGSNIEYLPLSFKTISLWPSVNLVDFPKAEIPEGYARVLNT
jgi:hypothetical protein